MSPAGRRPGTDHDTRGEIVEAAGRAFVKSGFARATIRSIAREAGVDPALVYHYFGDKAQLFAATLELPFDPRDVGEAAMPGDAPFDGTALAREFLTRFEHGPVAGWSFVALVQAAASSPEAARAIREFLAARIRIDDHDGSWGRRHAMIASALLGAGWSRWVLGVEPLASTPTAEVAEWLGPTLDHYAHDRDFADEPPLGSTR